MLGHVSGQVRPLLHSAGQLAGSGFGNVALETGRIYENVRSPLVKSSTVHARRLQMEVQVLESLLKEEKATQGQIQQAGLFTSSKLNIKVFRIMINDHQSCAPTCFN